MHGLELTAIDAGDRAMTEPKRKRVKTACSLCRKRKLRCDGQKPCLQCQTGNSVCSYGPIGTRDQNTAHCQVENLEEQDNTDHDANTNSTDTYSNAMELTICDEITEQQENSVTSPIIVADVPIPPDLPSLAAMIDQTSGMYGSTQGPTIELQPDNIFEAASDFWQMPFYVR